MSVDLMMMDFYELNKGGSLFLGGMYQPNGNDLVIEVKRSVTSNTLSNILLGDKTMTGFYKVSADESGDYFEISFDSCISYHVMNESFEASRDGEGPGNERFDNFCIYNESRYLTFVSNETFAADIVFPEELKHYALYCLNHIVHIVSTVEPHIKSKNYSE